MPVTLKRLATDIQLPEVPEAVHWTAPAEGRVAEEEIEFSWVGETARHIGTVVHRWLQRIAEDELRGWHEKRVDALRANFARELERRGVQRSQVSPAADLVVTALKNVLADERGRWVLGSHPQARSEHRVRVFADGRSSSLVIDRVFLDAEGHRWVVDFKTSRHEGADREGFLDRERERYIGQLENYGRAVEANRLGLLFPLLRGWREWRR